MKQSAIRRCIAVRAAAAALIIVPAVAAGPEVAAGPLDGWSSKSVEFVRNVPLRSTETVDALTTGAELVGSLLYVTAAPHTMLAIFDVSDPEDPVLLSRLSGGVYGSAREDPDTNGRILPLSVQDPETGSTDLVVVDVSDESSPRVLAQLDEAGRHTLSCIHKCRWAYGSDGAIIDLRDPENPRLRKEQWDAGLSAVNPANTFGISHDVTEVAPGLVMTSSIPMYLLDARRNVLRPRVLARSDGSPYSYGGVAWPGAPRGEIILSFGEPAGLYMPTCSLRDGLRGTSYDSAFKTWNAAEWRQTSLFTGIEEYFATDGTVTDGNPPASVPLVSGCAAHFFDVHPAFADGGLVAQAWNGNGLKILDVSSRGAISEVGWWLPSTAATAGVIDTRWISDDIVYSISPDRGIDILRFTPRR